MAPNARPRVTKRGGGGAPTKKAPGLTKDAKAKGSDANPTVSASKLKQVLTEEYPGQVDRWAGCPPAFCTSCEQYTGNIDKHSAEGFPKYLHWVQARRTNASVAAAASSSSSSRSKSKNQTEPVNDRFPSGHECYPCFDVRRKHFPGKGQDVLKVEREDPAVEDDFNDKRHDLVSGTGKYKGKVNKVNTIQKGESNFDREFVSGTAVGILDFAKKRNIKARDQDELIDIIRQKYPSYKIMVNKRGDIIVEILDQNDGEYRFERGTNDYIEYHKLEVYDDADDQKEAWNNKVAKREAKEFDRTLCSGDGNRDTGPELELAPPLQHNLSAETQTYPESYPLGSLGNVGPSAPAPATRGLVLVEDSQTQVAPRHHPLARLKSSSELGRFSPDAARLPLALAASPMSSRSACSAADNQSVAETHLEDAQGLGLDGSQSELSAAVRSTATATTARKTQDERYFQEDPKPKTSWLGVASEKNLQLKTSCQPGNLTNYKIKGC